MKKRLFYLVLALPITLCGQSNIVSTNPQAHQVLKGNYDPVPYSGQVLFDPVEMANEIESAVSPNSLKSYIFKLASFKNRNSGSDTLSNNSGIGAARRWVHQQFQEISDQRQGRLLPSYLQFDSLMCGMRRHRDVFAVLPGYNPASGFVLIEGHMDSRCDGLCDTTCLAEGVEDNATGTALVLELARAMSNWQFQNTIVFLVTTGEEQGLIGARAFSTYCQQNSLKLRAVLNNDVIGGIICGKTSSPPSCPGLNDVDSTSVRLFSSGGFNSKHKQLARFIKLQYKETILPSTKVPMNIRIMSPEDRTSRGGDHIPFRQAGFPAMRFTAANEHGDASNGPNYDDRQHTSDDVLGVDLDLDGTVDSFFVDFNYLARNTVINGIGAAIAARNVALPPDFTPTRSGNLLHVNFASSIDTHTIRIALRSLTTDWDTVYTIGPGGSDELYCNPTGALYVSVAGVDAFGAESLFSGEKITSASDTQEEEAEKSKGIELLQNKPNPFDEATWISFFVSEMPETIRNAAIQICDLNGRVISLIPVEVKPGYNETLYTHGYGVRGAFSYSLMINGDLIDSRQMIFAN